MLPDIGVVVGVVVMDEIDLGVVGTIDKNVDTRVAVCVVGCGEIVDSIGEHCGLGINWMMS